ncbi:MFS transporter [Hydrogenophaga sp. SL48]|uniref:MFS transporter n=1 Tax=Hydrogenophaga sp. SL48 TaxID=2806347 RepID=UPI001F00299E|nr:MFS transporter [Hydrogenophaga sp. SL48]UJW80538.1 MFS transporter [Hydrogenophaga sp. SL48]
MNTRSTSTLGHVALIVAHCAGMVDLVALPVWVGTLIQHYKLDPQQAGGLVTLFLIGAVVSSVFLASRFQRVKGRWVAAGGYALAAACFGTLSQPLDYATMAMLHTAGGLAAGAALSVTHGTIARSLNPHLKFALVGVGLGVFAVVFLGASPKIIAEAGGYMLFALFGAVMLLASLVCAVGFPEPEREPTAVGAPVARIPRAVWFGIVGISAMALVQSMTFSFLERVGADRGHSLNLITGVLVVMGLVNLLPAALAAMLEKRWNARSVLLAGPVIQVLLAAVIMNAPSFYPYAAAASVFAAVMIFTHTFAFGLLARLEPSGRAMAATPAMLMVGAAIGPVLGGTLVKTAGYGSLGLAALLIGGVAVACMSRLPGQAPALLAREAA